MNRYNASSLVLMFTLALAIMPVVSWGQKILISESGQKILLATDGSWSIVSSDEEIDITGKIIDNQTTNLDAFEAPTQGKYPLDIDQKKMMDVIMRNLMSDEAQLLVNYQFFADNVSELENQIETAKKVENKEQQKALKQQLKGYRESAKRSKKEYLAASELIMDARSISLGQEKNADKKIAILQEKSNSNTYAASGMGSVIEGNDIATDNIETTIGVDSFTPPAFYPTDFSIDDSSKPRGTYECNIVHDGFDPALDKKRKEVEGQFFFGFSQPKMKPYFKTEDFITCEAHVSKVGKKYYITMDIRIKSKDAQRTYGMLRSNETIRFELIDGSKVYCTNMIQDNGTIEAYTGHTLYSGIYEIKKDDLGTLKDNYLDNVGVIWSSGFEQYEIYNVDFLYNQLRCLEK